jgi:uncharacterized protein (TIGR03083 family)
MTDDHFGSAYRGTRQRVTELITSLPPEELEHMVPACPEWSLKDLFAHLAAIATDVVEGRWDGGGSPEWTARQIEERRAKSVEEIAREWEESGAQLEAALDGLHPAVGGGVNGDAVTHEQDARGAVRRAGGTDSAGFAIALDSYTRFFGKRLKNAGMPAVEVKAGDRWRVAGNGDPVISVAAEPFEMLRSLTGRRTRAQVRGLEWSGDPDPYLDLFSMYGMPEKELDE